MEAQKNGEKIVRKLVEAGYIAYFAGGWVRDLLMGHPSADIDIATNAPPEKIIELFPKTIAVGISFGVVIVVMKGHHFEVSTFRKDLDYQDGRRPTGIVLSTAQEDAERRDFTINGMFYDPGEERVIDYVQGREDLKRGIIRTIGNAQERFMEDRLRMIRAVRFAVRFGFTLEGATRDAIKVNAATLLPAVSMERIWQEIKKMAEYPGLDRAILEMNELGLLPVIFPSLQSVKSSELKRRVSSFADFPKGCPPILFLMELFPDSTMEQQLVLCRYLKVSNENTKCVEFVYEARGFIQKENEAVEWARFYAKPLAKLSLDVIAARLSVEERGAFLEKHLRRQKRLEKHIRRLVSKKPLVAAADLQEEGIAPSKRMGALLQEAERIAVNEDFDQKEKVMDALKKTSIWET